MRSLEESVACGGGFRRQDRPRPQANELISETAIAALMLRPDLTPRGPRGQLPAAPTAASPSPQAEKGLPHQGRFPSVCERRCGGEPAPETFATPPAPRSAATPCPTPPHAMDVFSLLAGGAKFDRKKFAKDFDAFRPKAPAESQPQAQHQLSAHRKRKGRGG